MKQPFFSVVMPTYNRARLLKRALRSVMDQSFRDFEIVVSDNASTDGTGDMIGSLKYSRIRYRRIRDHVPVQKNIQSAIEYARGKYIVLFGDDDILIDRNTFGMVKKLIDSGSYGIVRLNYLSISPDEQTIFDFRASKNLSHDERLPDHSEDARIVQFIEDMDSSFMSGLIFINRIPPSVRVGQSELLSWFPILFWAAKMHGGYFCSKPQVLATWSQWHPVSTMTHPLYSLKDGELSAEDYYGEVAKHLVTHSFRKFLRRQIMGTYVIMFPAAKYFTGNRNLVQLAGRILTLAPNLRFSVRFWLYFMLSLIIPSIILGYMRQRMLKDAIQRMKVYDIRLYRQLAYYQQI